jgi:predicted DNA-binding protein (MmcQ/YjbR family)
MPAIGRTATVSTTRGRAPRALSSEASSALERLRRLCAGWKDLEESLTFGHPTLRVGGTAFAVLDRYRDSDCLWLKVPPDTRATLLATPGWFEAPYDPRRTALCVRLETIDWRRIRAHVRVSYALAAVPRARQRRTGR